MRSKKLLLGAKHRRPPAKTGCPFVLVLILGVPTGLLVIGRALWEVIVE